MKKIQLCAGGQPAYPIVEDMYDDVKHYNPQYSDDNLLDTIFGSAQFGQTVYLSSREFNIKRTHNIPFGVSLKMQPYTIIRADENFQGSFLLNYLGSTDYIGRMQKRPDGTPNDNFNIEISGGILDGNCVASCLQIGSSMHYYVKDITLLNGKVYGVKTDISNIFYECFFNNVYAKCIKSGAEGNTAFYHAGADCHFHDCLSVDYTIGFYIGGHNFLSRCHTWGGPVGYSGSQICTSPYLNNSIGFELVGERNKLIGCYADTASIGMKIIGSSNSVIGCTFFNNYATYKLEPWIHIDNVGNNTKLIGCSMANSGGNGTDIIGSGTREIIGCTGFPQ